MKKIGISIGLVLLVVRPSWAGSNDLVFNPPPATYTDQMFHDFTKQAGLVISYLPLSPAEPLGITGFDIGAEVTTARISHDAPYWTAVTANNSPPQYLPMVKVHAEKGLPFGVDVGIVYSALPNSNVSLIGGEVKWAVVRGNLLFPAVALRASYTDLLGVKDLDLQTFGADLSVSKGFFGFFTPYAGVGEVWVQGKVQNLPSTNLPISTQNIAQTKGFVGAKFSLFIVNFVAEADFAEIPLYSARLNIGF